jgi:hypothetical protein
MVSAIFAWWSFGVTVDAADSFRHLPAWITRWDGPALLVSAMAYVVIMACAAVAIRNARSR